ncbi:ABC transporter substrate-binding protein [Jiangella alkaliphila]|uniref:Amino acid/amide ABC transporter substrate-binding protein, HAAT family n=1 Tax=Jiangella alkaliphila TaxID=419479 RepID=A0A1H2L2P0_9ACTN|nr:ABC transporter substrate-binding protein [Jiangella alkaliphila]SDU75283.1 amino acid/amide ABC transporter substrate-binding protein, HAAT family [Jiangella alkaliphila]
MTRTSRLWRSLAVAGAASLVLAACGGDDDGGTDDESPGAGGNGGTATSEDPLRLGTLLPETGNLAFLGPPEFAGVDLAIQEINEGGGVLGHDVEVTHTDSSDASNSAVTQQSTDSLLNEGVAAIIGAASSGVSFTVLDRIVQDETIMFSPANTSPDFTTYEDDGLYFRTAPSDVLQGQVLGDTILGDGHANVAILNLDDAYGNGLGDYLAETIESGGGTVAARIVYDPQASNYSAEVTQLVGAAPDAIALIGFEETVTIIPELVTQGIGPQTIPLYFVDGNLSNYGDQLPAGTLDGNKGTLPGAETGEDFQGRMLEIDPELQDFSYGPESYDATMLLALASIQAGSVESREIADNLVAVSREGTECSGFTECADLLADGEDIDYQGVSGPVEFTEAGDPETATIGVYQYGPDNTYTSLEFVERTME